MKKFAVRLLIAAFMVWIAVGAVHEFRANDTAGYYGAHPERLLYVLAIAAIGGAVAFGVHRLPPRAQRIAWQFSLGTLLLVTTAIALVLALIRIITM